MKQNILFFSILALAAAMTACNEDPEYYEVKDYPDQMHIQVSATDIVLDQDRANDAAITFTWTAAVSPVNRADKVTYGIRFYDANKKAESVTALYNVPEGQTQLTFTNDQLNKVVSRWAEPGEPFEVTVQLLAYIHNERQFVKPISSLVTFKATCYERFPAYLYLKFTDTATGNTRTERIEQAERGTGVYLYNGNLTPGTFVIGGSDEDEYPVYAKAEAETMTYVTEGSYKPFTCDDTGARTIVIDLNDDYNDCRIINMLQLPTPGMMWIVGDATPIGWTLKVEAGRFRAANLREPYLMSWTGEFTADKEFKIYVGSSTDGWNSEPFFYANEAGADPLTNHVLMPFRTQNQGGDLKWVPSVSGTYTLTLCLLADDLWTSFEPAE